MRGGQGKRPPLASLAARQGGSNAEEVPIRREEESVIFSLRLPAAAAEVGRVPSRRQRPLGRPRARLGPKSDVINKLACSATLLVLPLLQLLGPRETAQALRITNFRVPSYVPNSLPIQPASGGGGGGDSLTKPILFDCDYQYEPNEDLRLTVKWFKNKDPEPFYQWLPELDVRHFADWLKPLVDVDFVSDPHDALKRYRSLLIRRLSMNLTGQYTCLVSSLASQDMRQASLVVYQPPRGFHFEHRIFPPAAAAAAPAAPLSRPTSAAATPPSVAQRRPQLPIWPQQGASPTQFRGASWPPLPPPPPPPLAGPQGHQAIVRPANNNNVNNSSQSAGAQSKIVYTHDGRPVRRKSRRNTLAAEQNAVASWQLKKRLGNELAGPSAGAPAAAATAIQLHHFQCHASQVSPRPVLVLTVKRGADSIAQYLHESSSLAIRPYADQSDSSVTLYDATVSATVALNVSLAGRPLASAADAHLYLHEQRQAAAGINTVLDFRRGQRMSFECHLELTGTEFEQRKRINIDEEEVYRFAELEERRRRKLATPANSHSARPDTDSDGQVGVAAPDAFSSSAAAAAPVAPPRGAGALLGGTAVLVAFATQLLLAVVPQTPPPRTPIATVK